MNKKPNYCDFIKPIVQEREAKATLGVDTFNALIRPDLMPQLLQAFD